MLMPTERPGSLQRTPSSFANSSHQASHDSRESHWAFEGHLSTISNPGFGSSGWAKILVWWHTDSDMAYQTQVLSSGIHASALTTSIPVNNISLKFSFTVPRVHSVTEEETSQYFCRWNTLLAGQHSSPNRARTCNLACPDITVLIERKLRLYRV